MLLIHPQVFLSCEKMHVSHVKYFIHNVLFIDPVTLHQEREPFSSLSIGQALRLSESIFFIFYLHFFFFYIQGKCSFLIVNKYKTLLWTLKLPLVPGKWKWTFQDSRLCPGGAAKEKNSAPNLKITGLHNLAHPTAQRWQMWLLCEWVNLCVWARVWQCEFVRWTEFSSVQEIASKQWILLRTCSSSFSRYRWKGQWRTEVSLTIGQ